MCVTKLSRICKLINIVCTKTWMKWGKFSRAFVSVPCYLLPLLIAYWSVNTRVAFLTQSHHHHLSSFLFLVHISTQFFVYHVPSVLFYRKKWKYVLNFATDFVSNYCSPDVKRLQNWQLTKYYKKVSYL